MHLQINMRAPRFRLHIVAGDHEMCENYMGNDFRFWELPVTVPFPIHWGATQFYNTASLTRVHNNKRREKPAAKKIGAKTKNEVSYTDV